MPSNDPRRPNIVVVLTDDQGPWAWSGAGGREGRRGEENTDVVTPNLRRLADEGTTLRNFYCASPVCSPARASLLTGRMPSAHGVHDWLRGEAYGVVEDASYLDGLTTTPELLAAAGWTCGHAGKWHLGTAHTPAPGFSFWYAHRTGDGPYREAPVWVEGNKKSEPRYLTDAITEEALTFLDTQSFRDEPFYLEVNYTAPHSPWVGQHPREWTDLYDDCEFRSCPQGEPHPWFGWEPGPVTDAMRDPRPSLVGYFAAVSAMDAGVGRLLDRLDTLRLRASTLVLFTSDNGFSCGQHGIWGKGNATWPLNVWENSVRVPAIVSQPGRVPSCAVSDELVSACDVHPTLLDLAGVTDPGDPYAAGVSRAGMLLGGRDDRREAAFTFDEYGGTRMVRAAGWKYVYRADEGPVELYDLTDDPGELVNLAGDPARDAVRAELHTVLVDWFASHALEQRDAFNRPVSGRGQLHPVWQDLPDDQTYHSGAGEVRHAPG